MTYTISKDFAFSASHRLEGLPDGHPCGRLHGHNYRVRVRLKGDALDDVGFLLDYGELKPFGRWVDENLDHRHLNDAMGALGANPTAENLARWLAGVAGLVLEIDWALASSLSVGVSETPKTWAWWTP